MPVLTTNQNLDNANNFLQTVLDPQNSYYCFVARAEPWLDANGSVDESNIVVANNSLTQIELDTYQRMIFGKKITSDDVIRMAKRHNWANGTVYSRYDPTDPDLADKPFYVITDTNDVFKCIDNGFTPSTPNGVSSSVKPSVLQTSGNFTTQDGYMWKYMFTCDSNSYTKFQSNTYIPVTPNTSVVDNAKPGTIDVLTLTNSGNNYQVYETGFLDSFVNNYVIQLPSTSSPYDNHYTSSSVYLKTGYGSGQIRTAVGYNGLNKLLAVSPPFDYYENLKLSSINGLFDDGDIVTQTIHNIVHTRLTGYFNVGDILVQSDTQASGVLRSANATSAVVESSSSNTLVITYPLYNASYSHIQKNGTVSITNNAVYVNAVANTSFTSDYANNTYICVGTNANTNIRRVVSSNSTVITVDQPFTQTLTGTNNYLVNAAFSIDSFSTNESRGTIVFTNLNSADITYSNIQPTTASFTIGETVAVVDGANTSQSANGIVSFVDSSKIILTNVNGSINANLYLYGLSSQTRAYIDRNDAYPNIVVSTETGGFHSGVGISITYANSVPTGNAMVVSKFTSPNELTEYVISPAVTIFGDGNGALAYCTVDLSSNNAGRAITDIVLIDGGQNYTWANVTISSNALYGSGALVSSAISPVAGHGADPYSELFSTFVGISTKFANATSESYKLPVYGSYRTVGILKNPSISEVLVNLTTFDRVKLQTSNAAGSFTVGEIVTQPSSNAAGVVVFSNSTLTELQHAGGTFVSNSSVVGLLSAASANVVAANVSYFVVTSNSDTVVNQTSGGSAIVTQSVSNTQIRLANVVGSFSVGDILFEPTSNAQGTIVSIYTADGETDVSTTFGDRFNQTARISLSSNTGPFELYENVQQAVTYASGRVISTANELDVYYSTNTAFVVGDIIVNANTSANAIVVGVDANTKLLKLTAVSTSGFDETTNRPFKVGNTIRDVGNTKNTTISSVNSVLVLNNVDQIRSVDTDHTGVFQVGSYAISGEISGAEGLAEISGSISQPDLVRNTGKVVYVEHIDKFDRSPSTNEQVKLTVKF